MQFMGFEEGVVFVTLKQAIQSEALPPRISAQKVELIALTWALEIGKDKWVNIYTDCHRHLPLYMCMVLFRKEEIS